MALTFKDAVTQFKAAHVFAIETNNPVLSALTEGLIAMAEASDQELSDMQVRLDTLEQELSLFRQQSQS